MKSSNDSLPRPKPDDDDGYRDTLSSLTAAYILDRAVMDECSPPLTVADRCRYCLGAWQLQRLCRFQGHVRCAVTMHFQRRLVLFFDQNPAVTYWTVAQALEVSPAIVKAWWSNVRNPRKGPRPTDNEYDSGSSAAPAGDSSSDAP